MTKKENKLYTVNKYNKNLFYPGGPISIANNFLQSYKPNPYQGWQTTPDVSLSEFYDTIYPDRSWTLYPKTPTTGINVGPLTFNKTNIGLSPGYTLPQKIDYTKPITGLDFINTRSIGTASAFQPNTSIIEMDKLGDRGVGLGVTDAKTAADNIVSNNLLTKDMIKGGITPVKKPGFNWKAAAPAIGSGVGMIGNHVISDGFNTETGTAIANAGNMIGQAVGMANPILGGIISAGSGLLGGFWNRGFGVKKNEKNIAAITGNTAAARSAGNALAQAKDNASVIGAASNMVSGLNYSNSDLAKNGWFNSKGDKIANDLKGKQDNALAYQVNGLAMGANNADKYQDEIAQYNTVAFGGPLDSLMYNNDNMGAIEYGLLSDIITSKDKQADMKNKMPGIVGMPNNMFALGGSEDVYPIEQNDATRVSQRPLLANPNKRTRDYKYFLGDTAIAQNNIEAGGRRYVTKEQAAEIKKMVDQGLTEKHIANMLNKMITNNYNNDVKAGRISEKSSLYAFGGDKKIVASPSSVRVQKYPTNKQIKRKFTQDDYIHAGVYPSKNGGYHILDSDYKEIPISNEEAYRRVVEHAPIQDKAKARNAWQDMFGPWYTEYALGGDIQTHGADFTTGLASIDAGGSHEENPYDGVQVGVDFQGTPNLVEEGETIFNDYVFSKRIELDDQAKERFHVSKKRDITYAEMSKKLERESSERPNDPISQAALKMQMEDLQEEQERQKAEMQAEEAREAFENMSPEEQVAVMQQVEAQDQQAAEEEAAMQEQAMAEQQMSPEEAAMAEQQMAMQQQGGMPPEGMMQGMPQGIPMEAQMGAYGGQLNELAFGGNLFDDGGYKGALEWLQKNHPRLANKVDIAKVMAKRYHRDSANYMSGPLFGTRHIDFEKLYKTVSPRAFNDQRVAVTFLDDNHENVRFFNELVADGMPRNVAFGLAFPKEWNKTNSIFDRNVSTINPKDYTALRERMYNKLVRWNGKQRIDPSDGSVVMYGDASKVRPKSTSQVSSSTTQSSTAQAAKPAVQVSPKGRAQNNAKIQEFNSRMEKEFGKNWYKDLHLNKTGLSSLYQTYINGETSLDTIVNAAKSQVSPLATPTAGGDTLIANAPSGGGYSAGYSGYGYTGGGGGGYSAPASSGGTTVAAPTAGVSYVPLYNQDGSLKGYTEVPQQSAQATAQTTAAPATPTIAPYSVDSLRSQILGALGVSTASELQDWASKNNVTGFNNYDAIDWENLTGNQSFMDALNKGNSALAHAISQGYDFGKYRPDDLDKVTFATITQGNWDNQGIAGWRGSKDPAWQELLSKGLVDESKDYTPKQIEELLRGTDAFKRGTEWLQKSDKNRQIYLKAILDDPKSPPKAQEYARKFINDDGTWKTGVKTDYETIFNNPSGRAANPGTYWHTPTEIIRGNDTVNWVQKEDGTWDRVIGDVGSDWEKLNTYSWAGKGPDGKDLTYNYYKNPALAKAAAQKKADEAAAKEYEPVLKPEWPRYAGLFGPAVGLGMMAAGIGRPDTKQLDAVLDAYNRKGARFADYKPIGNYLTYNPMDPWANQNRMDANARATDRAIANNAGPLGTRNAGLVANSYASQLGTGQLHRDALAYNDQLEQQVAGFNRGTDQFNAESYNRAALQNAQIANHDRGLTAQLGMQAAAQKMQADAGWYGSMYGNINNLFKGISDLGTENARHNMIARMAADNLFGTITDNQHIGQGYVRERAAEGGNLNRKKNKRRKGGLTI